MFAAYQKQEKQRKVQSQYSLDSFAFCQNLHKASELEN